jgi:hypothetical protein
MVQQCFVQLMVDDEGKSSSRTFFVVEVTTNLLTWRDVGVLTVNSNGYCEFLDTNCHGVRLKFYRARKSP